MLLDIKLLIVYWGVLDIRYYLRFKKKVTLAPAEPFPSWPGIV